MRIRYDFHIQNFKDWVRTGGPINPTWAKETKDLGRDLHLAQCRAARRIFTAEQEGVGRCLGAFLVYRKQRSWLNRMMLDEREYQLRHLEELAMCNNVGKFERFGECDVAFVCHFCDGYIVWEDLESMPSIRSGQDTVSSPISPISPTTMTPNWRATGFSVSEHAEKTVVFAPIAIGSHAAPQGGEFLARLVCPFCDDESVKPRSEDGDEEDDQMRYVPDEGGFSDLAEFQEHLEWQHTAMSLPSVALPSAPANCAVM
jgi:hypothetical protein